MKNILLDTINDNTNLGQILSTYALYKTIEKLGDYFVVYDDKKCGQTKISEYIESYCCKLSESHAYGTEQEFRDQLHAVVTGSTKRWEYGKQETIESCFFSQEKDTVKRIAYAPSFGRKCEFPLGPKNAVFFALQRFNGIAAADRNTLEILNMEFGMSAEKVCHPVLLLEKYPYLDAYGVDGLFISTFFEKRDNQKQKVAEMAEETLKYRVIDYSKDQTNRNDKSVDEYLRAIEKSSLIITDSAVICHLAIVYKKPFIAVVSRQENDAYECLSTLDELGLMERVIYIEDDVREKKYLCRKPIRYGMVDSNLDVFRMKSVQWLKEKLM